jgi:hypothetical protein
MQGEELDFTTLAIGHAYSIIKVNMKMWRMFV